MKSLRTALCILLLSAGSANAKDGNEVYRGLQSDMYRTFLPTLTVLKTDGNEVLRDLQSTVPGKRNYMVGYINGLWLGMQVGTRWTLNAMAEPNLFFADISWSCTPKGAGTTQLADVVVKYLKDRPEVRHRHFFLLLPDALREAFPCPPE